LVGFDKHHITIRWTTAYNGGDDVDDYEIDWKIDTNDLFDTIYSTGNLTTFTIAGLETGRLY
jgi:hypothetical protein